MRRKATAQELSRNQLKVKARSCGPSLKVTNNSNFFPAVLVSCDENGTLFHLCINGHEISVLDATVLNIQKKKITLTNDHLYTLYKINRQNPSDTTQHNFFFIKK